MSKIVQQSLAGKRIRSITPSNRVTQSSALLAISGTWKTSLHKPRFSNTAEYPRGMHDPIVAFK